MKRGSLISTAVRVIGAGVAFMLALVFMPASAGVAATGTAQVPTAADIAANGAQELFVVNAAGQLMTTWQTSPGGTWTGWVKLVDTPLTPHSWIATGRGPNGAMEIYLISPAGQLVTMWQKAAGGTWTDLVPLSGVSGYPQGAPMAVGIAANRAQELYIVDGSGNLMTMWQTSPGGRWTGLRPLNGVNGLGPNTPVGVGNGPGGVMEIYVVPPSGALMTMWQTYPDGTWTGLEQLNAVAGLPAATPVGVGFGPNGVQEIYFTGKDRQSPTGYSLYTMWQTSSGGVWTGVVNLNNAKSLQSSMPIAVGRAPSGAQEIYLVNNGSLQTMWQKGSGGSWTGWVNSGAPWGTTYGG